MILPGDDPALVLRQLQQQRAAIARAHPSGVVGVVRGGAGGAAVATAALSAAAATLDRVAQALGDERARIQLAATEAGAARRSGRQLDPVGAMASDEALRAAMAGSASSLERCIDALGHLAMALRAAVRTYEAAEAAVHASWSQVLSWIGMNPVVLLARFAARPLLPALVPGILHLGARIDDIEHPNAASHPGLLSRVMRPVLQLIDPGELQTVLVLGATMLGGPGTGMAGGARATARVARADGLFGGTRTRVTPFTQASVDAEAARGAGPGGRLPLPTTMATGTGGLLRIADVMGAGPGMGDYRRDGRVVVQRITLADGRREAVVSIPGTRTWTSGGRDPMDLQSNIEAVAGERTAADDAVERALAAAGVGPDEPLLLVGHSQGGLTAEGLAADRAFRRRFHPVAVLTAGSPVAADRVPAGIATLNLEHEDDYVPSLDGLANPVSGRHVTVAASTPLGRGAHYGYERTGDLVDSSRRPSLAEWKEAIAPFVSDGSSTDQPAQVVTTEWEARRVTTASG